MTCPNCKKILEGGSICPQCKIDTVLYGGIARLSDKYYNQALEKLKASDFTNAIELLGKSITTNKSNTLARNLLGLALFEIGHVGEAIKQWVISSSLGGSNNLAEGYLERARKNSRTLEKLNDVVIMYNNALGHLKNKSDDLAIIQLKRAVEINPNFVDALNLLTLCHLIQNDKERAIATAERVLTIDTHNPTALGYLKKLNHNKNRPARAAISSFTKRQKPENSTPYKAIGIQDKKAKNFHIVEILAFVIGAACGVAVIYFLLFPALEQERENDLARAGQQLEYVEEAHQAQLAALESDIMELEHVIADRDFTINELNQAADFQDRILHAQQAFLLYHEGQLRDAITILDDFETDDLPFDIRDRITAIYASAYPQLALSSFNQGRTAFNANDPYRALPLLEDAFRFWGETGGTNAQRRDMLDMLGELYENAGRLEDALDMLRALQIHSPNHNPTRIRNSIQRIEDRM